MAFTFDIRPHNETLAPRQLETVYSRPQRPKVPQHEHEGPLPQAGLQAGSRNLFIRRASLETRKNCCLRCPPSARPDLRQLLRIRCPVCVLVRAALRSLQSLAGANSIIVSMPSVLQRSRLCFLPALSLAGVFQQSPECACNLLCLLCPCLEPKH